MLKKTLAILSLSAAVCSCSPEDIFQPQEPEPLRSRYISASEIDVECKSFTQLNWQISLKDCIHVNSLNEFSGWKNIVCSQGVCWEGR
jgi:hypothetical protein